MGLLKIDYSKTPYENCPSFEKCSTNKCPLHPSFLILRNEAEDKKLLGWKKCRAGKKTRIKIGDAFNIKSRGLSLRELDSMKKSLQLKKQILLTQEKSQKTLKNGNRRGDTNGNS